jgi:hypothetical protein
MQLTDAPDERVGDKQIPAFHLNRLSDVIQPRGNTVINDE